MKFDFDLRESDSPFVESIWRTNSVQADSFTSTAEVKWEMVLMRHQGRNAFVVRGPETKASPAPFPADAEWLGITFKLGTYIPILPLTDRVDGRNVELPESANNTFWLDGKDWEFPTFENADTFIRRLEREGLLAHDPVVGAVMQGEQPAYSPRALQYRFVRATGLSQKVIQQIERAKQAVSMLRQGVSISDATFQAGYFDQSHLTNALRRFIGQTPTQIAAEQSGE